MTEREPQDRSRYKPTRELVRIALAEGMTQSEIAQLCRVQQSQVSLWKNGKKLAWDKSLEPLIKKYAHRLGRTASEVYLSLIEGPNTQKWSESEEGRAFHQLGCEIEHRKGVEAELEGANYELGDLEQDIIRFEKDSEPSSVKGRHGRVRLARRPRGFPFPIEDLEPPPHKDKPKVGELDPAAEEQQRQDKLKSLKQALEDRREVVNTLHQSLKDLHDSDLDERLNAFLQKISHGDEVLQEIGLFIEHRQKLIERLESRWKKKHTQLSLIEVVGEVIFQQPLYTPSIEIKASGHKETLRLSARVCGKWRVHRIDDGRLVLVRQHRRHLDVLEQERWKALVDTEQEAKLGHTRQDPSLNNVREPFVLSDDDAGRWVSIVEPPRRAEALRARVCELLGDTSSGISPHDALTLPFLLDRALIRRGIPVAGVTRIDRTTPGPEEA